MQFCPKLEAISKLPMFLDESNQISAALKNGKFSIMARFQRLREGNSMLHQPKKNPKKKPAEEAMKESSSSGTSPIAIRRRRRKNKEVSSSDDELPLSRSSCPITNKKARKDPPAINAIENAALIASSENPKKPAVKASMAERLIAKVHAKKNYNKKLVPSSITTVSPISPIKDPIKKGQPASLSQRLLNKVRTDKKFPKKQIAEENTKLRAEKSAKVETRSDVTHLVNKLQKTPARENTSPSNKTPKLPHTKSSKTPNSPATSPPIRNHSPSTYHINSQNLSTPPLNNKLTPPMQRIPKHPSGNSLISPANRQKTPTTDNSDTLHNILQSQSVIEKLINTSDNQSEQARFESLKPDSKLSADLGCEAMDIEFNETATPSQVSEETMDWEVNEFRKDIKDSSEPTCLSDVIQNSSHALAPTSQLILILDSNVFISSIKFVERIIDCQVPGLGYPVIYVPHRVLNELDGLKQCRRGDVDHLARKAVDFLNKKLTERHARVSVQSLKDYLLSSHDVYLNSDDKILLSCLQIKEYARGKRVILLSNDINLRNKAIVEDVETFSVSEFEALLVSMSEDIRGDELNMSLLGCKLKTLLKSVFEQVLRVESRVSRRNLTLDNCMEHLIKDWQSRFSNIVTIYAEENLALLNEVLQTDDINAFMMRIIEYAHAFLSCFCIRRKPYFTHVKKTLVNLELIRRQVLALAALPPPDEHDVTLKLENIFRECVDQWEIEMANALTQLHNGEVAQDRIRHLADIIKSLEAALGHILQRPILQASNSPAIDELAKILANNSSLPESTFHMMLKKAAVRESGRDVMEETRVIFGRAYVRCTNHLKSVNPRTT